MSKVTQRFHGSNRISINKCGCMLQQHALKHHAAAFGMASQVAEPESSGLGSYIGSSGQNEAMHLTHSKQKKNTYPQKSLKSQKITNCILDRSFAYYTIWLSFFTKNKGEKKREEKWRKRKRKYNRSLLKVTENDKNKYPEQRLTFILQCVLGSGY